MLKHATLEQLQQMKFHGMARAFEEQLQARFPDVYRSFDSRNASACWSSARRPRARKSRRLTHAAAPGQAARASRDRGRRLPCPGGAWTSARS